jgi:preprotein translocase subunit YajC
MTLGQFLLLILIVIVFWMGKKMKKHEDRLKELENKSRR